jgi:Tol biopolymer transport system component
LEKTLSLEGYLLVLVSWSPDGSKLASQDLLPPDLEELQGARSRVHIWNTNSWEIEQILPQEYRYGEITFPFALMWSADSLSIVGTGSDENLREVVFIANISTGEYFYPFPQITQITALDWTSDGLLAAGTNYDLNIYDVNSQQLLYIFHDVYRVRDLSWSPDGTKLLFLHNTVDIYAMSDYGAGQSIPDLAEIWDYSTGLRVASLSEHSYEFTWNPDSTKLVAVGRNANDDGLALEIWDVSNLPAVSGIPTLTPYPFITPTPNLVATPSS